MNCLLREGKKACIWWFPKCGNKDVSQAVKSKCNGKLERK